MRTVRCLMALGCGLVVLLASGCGPGAKDMQIQAQQEEINRLQAEKSDMMGGLSAAMRERDEARGQVFDLQRRIHELEAELARKPAATTVTRSGWTGELPGIAWLDLDVAILFDSGKATLKAQGRDALQQVVTNIRRDFPTRQVWVVGHTDSDPIKHSKWKDNLELSVQRACTVYRELQKSGLDPQRMIAAGQGEHNPKVANTPQTKSQNRRVQVIAVEVPDTARIGGSQRG